MGWAWGPGRLKEHQPELAGGGGPTGPWNAATRVWDPGTRQEGRQRGVQRQVRGFPAHGWGLVRMLGRN